MCNRLKRDDCELTEGCFQQHGATCRRSARSMAEIYFFFGDKVISKAALATMVAGSDATSLLRLGMLKGNIYQNKPHTVEDLKDCTTVPP